MLPQEDVPPGGRVHRVCSKAEVHSQDVLEPPRPRANLAPFLLSGLKHGCQASIIPFSLSVSLALSSSSNLRRNSTTSPVSLPHGRDCWDGCHRAGCGGISCSRVMVAQSLPVAQEPAEPLQVWRSGVF